MIAVGVITSQVLVLGKGIVELRVINSWGEVNSTSALPVTRWLLIRVIRG